MVAPYLAPISPVIGHPYLPLKIFTSMCIVQYVSGMQILVLCLAFQPDQIFITGSGVDGQRGVIIIVERISNGDSFSKCTCAHMYWLDLEMLIIPRSAPAGHLSDSSTKG